MTLFPYTTLFRSHVDILSPLKSYERLNEILSNFKTIYKDKVEYINIYQVGSVFHVEYTKRKQDKKEKDDYQNLYAKKDGMIESFDVDSGLIKIKKNDYVKKGDLLVENTLISTQNETKIIPVKGHVYAYTFNQYEASVKNVNQDQGEVFYQLLLSILTFHSGEDRIVKKSFKQFYKEGLYREISNEVIRPSAEECNRNSRARSTKMRWAIRAEG